LRSSPTSPPLTTSPSRCTPKGLIPNENPFMRSMNGSMLTTKASKASPRKSLFKDGVVKGWSFTLLRIFAAIYRNFSSYATLNFLACLTGKGIGRKILNKVDGLLGFFPGLFSNKPVNLYGIDYLFSMITRIEFA